MAQYSSPLSYLNQHLGWTQRINKELGAANRYKTLLTLNRLSLDQNNGNSNNSELNEQIHGIHQGSVDRDRVVNETANQFQNQNKQLYNTIQASNESLINKNRYYNNKNQKSIFGLNSKQAAQLRKSFDPQIFRNTNKKDQLLILQDYDGLYSDKDLANNSQNKQIDNQFNNQKYESQANGFSPVRQFMRTNQDLKNLKRQPFYLIDSTYMVASDPNTMRDQGLRIGNAEYQIINNHHDGKNQRQIIDKFSKNSELNRIFSQSSQSKRNKLASQSLGSNRLQSLLRSVNVGDAIVDGYNNRPSSQQFIKPLHYSIKTLNQQLYLNSQNYQNKTPIFQQQTTLFSQNQSKRYKKPTVVIDERGEPLIQLASGKQNNGVLASERVQKYTKNISQDIFNPAHTHASLQNYQNNAETLSTQTFYTQRQNKNISQNLFKTNNYLQLQHNSQNTNDPLISQLRSSLQEKKQFKHRTVKSRQQQETNRNATFRQSYDQNERKNQEKYEKIQNMLNHEHKAKQQIQQKIKNMIGLLEQVEKQQHQK